MRTALDSAILIDVLQPHKIFGPASKQALQNAWKTGSILVCDIAWAEIRAAFPHASQFSLAIAEIGIVFDPLKEASAELAGALWREYRRREGVRQAHVVADFLIGAHALLQADALLTRDRGFYRDYFRNLKIIDPSRPV